MQSLVVEGYTVIFKGTSKDVSDLHVRELDGCLLSKWEPTPKELELLLNGAAVELWIKGSIMPPVALKVSGS